MIKDFETYIREGRMGRLVNTDEASVRKQDELTEDIVRSYIRKGNDKNCKRVTIRYEHGEPIVDIDGDFVFIEDITEIPFQFGKVTGNFSCDNCIDLTSLEGCPKEVGRNFACYGCSNLISLEWCPKKVGGYFNCINCPNLISLEGCPKEVGGSFGCSDCDKLTSLEGCPKEVGRGFYCSNCGKKFTEKEVCSLCNVKGDVFV